MPPLAYQHAGELRRAPAGVLVLSILGIVLASAWLLVGAYGLLMSAGLLFMFWGAGGAQSLGTVDGLIALLAWQCGTAVVRGLLGVFLLVASIACLRMARWGRAAMVRYAQVDLAWIAVKLIVALAWAVPAERDMPNRVIQAIPTTAATTTAPAGPATAPATPTRNRRPTSMAPTGRATGGGRAAARPVAMTWGGGPPAAVYNVSVNPFSDAETWPIYQSVLLALGSVIYPMFVLRYMTRRRIREAFDGVMPGPPAS
jgi:hypothetical protein